MLDLRAISKSFPGVLSLDEVDFSVRAGEVRALVGENGAGKSTLIKIIGGVYRPDKGKVLLAGREVRWRSPLDAWTAGIQVVFQELTLFPDLTVAENILLGQEPRGFLGRIDYGSMERLAVSALERLGMPIDVSRYVRGLSVAEQQMVEIARALVRKTKVLVLDEPTAVIAGQDVSRLFAIVRSLQAEGVAVIFISHRLEEVFEIADTVTVLKDGRHVTTAPVTSIDRKTLVSLMVGRDIADIFPPAPKLVDAVPVLRVEDLADGSRVHGVTFHVGEGEIVGIAGLVGSGRTELAHLVYGSRPAIRGRVSLDGRYIENRQPKTSIQAGIGFLTEDRKAEGLFLQLGVDANITAPRLDRISHSGMISHKAESLVTREAMADFGIVAPYAQTIVAGLSGGNQQKVLLARWVRACRRLLILDEPTRGVDVGAKLEIYRLTRSLSARGIAVLVISSELPEIIGLSDRAYVMREGRLVGELARSNLTEEAAMTLMTGGALA